MVISSILEQGNLFEITGKIMQRTGNISILNTSIRTNSHTNNSSARSDEIPVGDGNSGPFLPLAAREEFPQL
jgi:hypothetical protein